MSRVAEVFRKSGVVNAGETALSGTTDGTVADPWNLAASSQPSRQEPSEAHSSPQTTLESAPSDVGGASESPDELTRLAQRLFLGPVNDRLRSVLFAPGHCEGDAGAVTAGTADALSRLTPGRICVVDANLRSPSLDTVFGVDGVSGLSNVLLGDCKTTNCLVRLRENLWLLPAGSGARDAATSHVGSDCRARLQELQSAFDHVIVSISGAGMHRDVMMVATVVDGVVLVVDATATRRESARRIVDRLRAAQVAVFGAVLTNRTFPIPESIYRRL